MKLQLVGDTIFGFAHDCILGEWINHNRREIENVRHILVTCIDSALDIGQTNLLARGFGRLVQLERDRQALDVSGIDLIHVYDAGGITGYDELVIYSDGCDFSLIPSLRVPPRLPVEGIVSDYDATIIASQMRDIGVQVILGDGFGLWYCSTLSITELNQLGLGHE